MRSPVRSLILCALMLCPFPGKAQAIVSDLLVTSRGTGEVLRFDGHTGAFVEVFASENLVEPTDLEWGPDGELYVADAGAHNVLKYSGTTGAFLGVYTSGHALGQVNGLAFGNYGYLYVSSDGDPSEIVRYEAITGEFSRVLATAPYAGLSHPEELLFSHNSVQVIDSGLDGLVAVETYETAAGWIVIPSGSGGLADPGGITYGPTAYQLCISNRGANNILRYDGSGAGTFAGVFAEGGGLDGPAGLAFGNDGNLYVCSENTNSILRYDGTTGAFLDEFVAPGTGGLSRPSHLLFMPCSATAVYRFWSPVLGHHFYTSSVEERDKLLNEYSDVWHYEWGAWRAYTEECRDNLSPVYRFWSPVFGSHFYTIDEAEKDYLIATYPSVWSFEGIAYLAYKEWQPGGWCKHVYRFWSPTLRGHFYTINTFERDRLINLYSDVWRYEGIAWYVESD